MRGFFFLYSGVKRHVSGQLGVMMWVRESILVKTGYYKFWNDRIIETGLKIHKGHLTILVVCVRVVNSRMLFCVYIMVIIFFFKLSFCSSFACQTYHITEIHICTCHFET